MKKFFKRLGKLVGYAMLYVVITLGTAIGILFLPSSSPTLKPVENEVVAVAPQINKIYQNISTKNALRLNAQLVTQNTSNNIVIDIDADLNLNEGSDKLQVKGKIDAAINEQHLPITFCYKQDVLYLSMGNGKFAINTKNIAQSFNQILSTLGFSLSSVGLDLDNLDIEGLLGMLSDLKETIGNDVITLDITVPVVGSIQIICDLNYNLKSLSLPQTIIDGTTIKLSTNLSYPAKVEVEKPKEDYLDISGMFDVVSSTLDYLTNDSIGLEVNFEKGENSFSGNLYADLKALNAKYEMDLLGQKAKLFAINKVLYLELGNLNLKFDLDSLPDAFDILNSHFNLNIPVEFIKEVLSTPKEEFLSLDFSKLLTGDKDSTLSQLDMSIIENFTKTDEGYLLALKDIGNINFNVADGKFGGISYQGDFLLGANAIKAKDVELSSSPSNYIDVAQTLPAIDSILNTINQQYILANGQISYAGAHGDFNFAGNLKDGQCELTLNAFNKNINFSYLDNVGYLTFDNNKFFGNKDDIETLLNKLGLNLDKQNLIETLTNLLDSEKNQNLVKDIISGDGWLKIVLLDDNLLTLNYDKCITSLELVVGTATLTCNLTYPTTCPKFSQINQELFTPASVILDKIASIYQYFKNKTYYLTMSAQTKNNQFGGFVNYENGQLAASIEIAGNNNLIAFVIKDEKVYLNINGGRYTFLIKDVKDVIEFIKNQSTLDLTEILNKIDLDSLIENILDSTLLSINQNNIILSFKDLIAQVVFENQNIYAFNINGSDITSTIKVENSATIMPEIDTNGYSSLSDLSKKASTFIQYLNGNEQFISLSASYKGLTAEGKLNFVNNTITGQLILSFNQAHAYLRIKNDTIYFDYKDLHISCSYLEIDNLLSLLDKTLNLNLTNLLNNLVNRLSFNSTIIDKILSNSKLDYLNNTLNLSFDNVFAQISFEEDMLSSIDLQYLDFGATVQIEKQENKLDSFDETCHIPLSQLIEKIKSVLNYVKDGKLYLKLNATYKNYNFNGYINIDENGISLAISNKDENLQLKLKNKVIYLDFNNLKLLLALEDIGTIKDFLQQQFGLDLSSLLSDFDKIDIVNILEQLNLKIADNSLQFNLSSLSGQILFDGDNLSGAKVNFKDFAFDGEFTNAPYEITPQGRYTNVSDILPYIAMIKNYLMTKQYNLSASATVYEKNTPIYSGKNMTLQLDAVGKLKFYANIAINGRTNLNIEAASDQNATYFDYNGLALKMSQNDFDKIIGLVLDKLGQSQPLIKNLLGGEFDFKSLANLFNENDFSISKLDIIENIQVKNNALIITLDGSNLAPQNVRASQMQIKIMSDGNRLTQISFKNFYTGVTSDEHFDLDVTFKPFEGITKPNQNKKYIDLTGSGNLIEAALNTISSYKAFEIVGSFKINLKFGLINIDWDIPINLKISLLSGKPEIQATVGVIPVIDLLVYNLNNDTPWSQKLFKPLSINNRMLYIYYSDGYVYFYRHETNSSGKSYEKALKANLESVLDDILYYVKWGTGFNDDIIGAITESAEGSKSHSPNLGKIINGFTCPGNNQYYTLSLNLNELTGSDKMGDLAIGASVKKLSGKDVLDSFMFDMDMPLIWGTTLYIKSNSLTLNLGNNLNMTSLERFTASFENKNGKESVEYVAENGSWKRAGEKTFTVSFNTGFSDITQNSITGKVNQSFTLPKYQDKVIGTKHPNCDYTVYKFAGWYTDKGFKASSEFKQGVIPAKNTTLYAKWEIIDGYRTINYYRDGKLILSEHALIYSPLRSDLVDRHIEFEQNGKLIKQEFIGWQDKDGILITHMPEENTDVYALYETEQSLNRFNLTINQGVAGKTILAAAYETLSLSTYLPNYQDLLYLNSNGKTDIYSFGGWFVDDAFENEAPELMPSNDLTIYAKWDYVRSVYEYTLNIYDNDTLYTQRFTAGMPIILSKDVPIYSNTLWYSDKNFTIPASRPVIMPEHDLTLYIRNKYNVSYTYYTLTNGKFTENKYTSSFYQGSTFNLYYLNPFEEIQYKNGVPDKMVGYYFDGYKTADGKTFVGNTVPNHDLTLYASYTTKSKNYYTITYHTDWVEPAWWTKSKNEQSSNRSLEKMYVLEGSYIYGTTLYEVTSLSGAIKTREIKVDLSRTYLGLRYYFNSAAWNRNGCKNLYKSAFGNSSANASKITVNSNINLYVEWQHIK